MSAHVYHILILAASSQSCCLRAKYLPAEKEAARRFAVGHFPESGEVQGLVVQQPMNSVVMFSQM